MRFSRILGTVLAIVVPIAETVRRWHTWRDEPVTLFDDYVLAAILLFGVWFAGRDPHRGPRSLAGAWGIVCGVGYGSFLGQLYRLRTGEPDPAPIPSEWVAAIKGGLLALAILALLSTVWSGLRPGDVNGPPRSNAPQ